MSPQKKSVYRVFFVSQGKGYEIYARRVSQGEMYGFVEIEEIVFGEKSTIVVDPNEDALRNEFAGVKRLLIPYHAVSRIEEVAREGQAKVIPLGGQGTANGSGPLPPPFKKET